jgi:hypothetical protein
MPQQLLIKDKIHKPRVPSGLYRMGIRPLRTRKRLRKQPQISIKLMERNCCCFHGKANKIHMVTEYGNNNPDIIFSMRQILSWA